jgi:diguanylate cyclase (GGDEF)-like protein
MAEEEKQARQSAESEYPGPGLIGSLGLRARLLLALSISALLPLAALYTMGYQAIAQNNLAILNDTVEHVASVQRRRANVELYRLQEALDLLASRTQMRRSLQEFGRSGNLEAKHFVERILSDALNSSSSLEEVWIRDISGNLVASVGVRNEASPLDSSLSGVHASMPRFEVLWDEADEPQLWLTRQLDLEGEIIGSLGVRASLLGLSAVLDDFALVELAGQTSVLLASQDSYRWLLPVPGMSALAEQLNRMDAGEFRHVRAQALLAPTQLNGFVLRLHEIDHGLGDLVVHASLASLDARLRAEAGTLLALTGLALLPGLILAWLVAAMISRPVERLTRAAKDLRDGRPTELIQERFWGEFADLTASFNHALQVITGRTQDLYQEIRTRRIAEQQLFDLANTDTLTGLANRRAFFAELDRVLSAESLSGTKPVGNLFYLDLDGFKPINDRLGHAVGDQVLKAVGRRLRNLVREGDIAARLGGDEFALLLLPESQAMSEPAAVAERIEQQISRPLQIGHSVISVGCSVGVVDLYGGDRSGDVVQRADEAMYAAKRRRQLGKA